jgi:hypothetical protein
MANARKMCFDRMLPKDLQRQQETREYAPGRVRAISLIGKQWMNGATLRIRFLTGTSAQRDMVRSIAPEWTNHANLGFEFTEEPTAEIRVAFDENDGAWSYVGTDNLSIPLHASTLNLGWQDEGVILHEFGHMIGLSHEHSNPDGGINWNEEAVIRDLSGPPNYWDEETIRRNVLRKYEADQIHGTSFDPDSIMLYAFPPEWTTDGFGTHENEKLSDLDKMFVKGAAMYPPTDDPEPDAVELSVAEALEASISETGEMDLYKFVVDKQGKHTFQTLGTTDLVVTLFGPDSLTKKIAEDDDSGAGRNSLIAVDLTPGVYYAQIRHFSDKKTGSYRIIVSR